MPQYDHDPAIDREEVKALAFVARRMVCKTGSACRDDMCIYGHVCLNEPNCTKGSKCYFKRFHGINTIPVNVVDAD